MGNQIEVSNTVITFLSDVKAGKYAVIEKGIIEMPRNELSRDEYIFEEGEMSVLYGMSN